MLKDTMVQVFEWMGTCGEMHFGCGLGLAICMIVASLGVPRALLNVTAGATFGLWSLSVIQPSATIGALLAFLIARHFLAERIRRWTETGSLVNVIADSVDWKVVALMRLASPVPSPLASYMFGVTRVGVWPFTIATLIFTLPQNLLQVYLGATGRAILLEGMTSPLELSVMLAGLVCFAVTTLVIARRARSALQAVAPADRSLKRLPQAIDQ